MAIEDPRQRVALSGVVASLFFSFSYILIAGLYLKFDMPIMDNVVSKLVFAIYCSAFAALPLMLGQLAVVVRKLLQLESLDGEFVQVGSRLDIHMQFVNETTNHLLLFVITLLNLAPFLEGDFLRLMPAMTSWFIVGRMCNWFAHLISPPYRVFGSAATLAPSVFFLCLCIAHLLRWL
ncbi:MAG TPA: hypothetical protein PLF22_07565 [Pseudomonadales bacterium]|nr:hypothetical protein [Pseudomonadales bacterium]